MGYSWEEYAADDYRAEIVRELLAELWAQYDAQRTESERV